MKHKPIIIFEQDCIYASHEGFKLDEAYCRNVFSDFVHVEEQFASVNDIPVTLEYEDDDIVIYQVLNCEGESWKLIQVKV